MSQSVYLHKPRGAWLRRNTGRRIRLAIKTNVLSRISRYRSISLHINEDGTGAFESQSQSQFAPDHPNEELSASVSNWRRTSNRVQNRFLTAWRGWGAHWGASAPCRDPCVSVAISTAAANIETKSDCDQRGAASNDLDRKEGTARTIGRRHHYDD